MNIRNCTNCSLHHQRLTIVNGSGKSRGPTLFLVGEAPDKEDEYAGQPFSFKSGSGRVLNALLADARISRNDCYVTFATRCRPPNNRAPEVDECNSCSEHLKREIADVKPSIIVALGDTATTLLTGKALSIWRGSIVDGIGPAAGYKVGITERPAFVMRMRTMFSVVAWDLAKFAKGYVGDDILEEYDYYPSRKRIIEVFKHIVDNDLLTAIDIETSMDKEDEDGDKSDALNPWKGDIIGIAFCWEPGKAMQLDKDTMNANWDIIHTFLESHQGQLYANNLFDRVFCLIQKKTRPLVFADVQSMMHLIYAALPKKLDFLRSIYTLLPPYKYIYKQKSGGKYRPELLSGEDCARLNCLDVDATLQIFNAQREYVSPQLIEAFRREEEMALEMKVRGVKIDQRALSSHYIQLLPKVEQLEKDFNEMFGVRLSSPKQLNQLLYDRLDLPKHDDKGKPCSTGASTNEKAIQAISSKLGLVYINDEDGERFEGEHQHKEIFANILEFRGYSKILSTYCEGIFKSIQSDDRVHPDWKPTGTDTGRWSCKKVPLQGVPKDMRDIVVAGEGKIFMGADYKGAQICGAAVLSGQMDLMESMLRPDFSIHNDVLEMIKPHYPSIKKIQAKTVVFGKFFGRTDRDIASQFHVTTKTVELWTSIFYAKYPKLREFLEEKLPREWEANGYITTIDGRRKYCERVTEAKNTPIQNFESVLTKTAMWKLRENNFNLVLMGHDQIVCEEPDDYTKDDRFKLFIEIMETALPQYYPKFPVDGGMGYTWAEV